MHRKIILHSREVVGPRYVRKAPSPSSRREDSLQRTHLLRPERHRFTQGHPRSDPPASLAYQRPFGTTVRTTGKLRVLQQVHEEKKFRSLEALHISTGEPTRILIESGSTTTPIVSGDDGMLRCPDNNDVILTVDRLVSDAGSASVTQFDAIERECTMKQECQVMMGGAVHATCGRP